MAEGEFGELEAGARLDCLVHDLIFAYRGPETEVAPYSTQPWAMGPVVEYLAGKCRYFGLMHSYDGLWVAMAGDAVDCFALFDANGPFLGERGDGAHEEDDGEADDPPVRCMDVTPMMAICGLALAVGKPERGQTSAEGEPRAGIPCFEWAGTGGFSD